MPTTTQAQDSERGTVLALAEEFTAAIVAGDSARVTAVLARDAIISEGGKVESKVEYISGHFHGDSAYLAAIDRDQKSSDLKIVGDVAWLVSTTHMHGTYREREVDSISVETLVLHRSDSKWEIAAVHWSSGRRQ